MTTDTTYNGWHNYETWLVNLWLDNSEGSQEYWREMAEQFARETDPNDIINDRKHDVCMALADLLKAEHEEATPELTGVFADLLNAALSAVYWYEIAEHMVSDLDADAFPVSGEEVAQ